MHRLLCALIFVALSTGLLFQVSRLHYKEDISDFLPLGNDHQNALKVYQNISGANKMFAIFQCQDSTQSDPDILVEAIELFTSEVEKHTPTDTKLQITSQIDIEKMSEMADFVYQNIPLFLTERDYARIDSLLASPDYIRRQIQEDKQMLMFPAGGLLSGNIQGDPLNIFTPVVSSLQQSSGSLKYEMYGGYIFSPDMQRAIVMVDSPYGASETEQNAKLVQKLDECAKNVSSEVRGVQINLTGGPVIAVGNATQIKTDSFLSVAIAVGIILLILLVVFRSVKNLILIIVSIGWGWLFGLGGLAIIHDSVSIIVIGISSVILGIAVNYPLHLLAHLYHTTNMRNALREIIAPLVVGNITTVGAFLSLVPLDSVALKDLGLFSSFLLIGTIVFVLLFLPHLSSPHKPVDITLLNKASDFSFEKKPWIIWTVIALTLVFGYFSTQTSFDSNMSHINYMSEQQKTCMEYFQKNMTRASDKQSVYVVSSGRTMNEALDKSLNTKKELERLQEAHEIVRINSCTHFLTSEEEQARRIGLWNTFVAKHGNTIKNVILSSSHEEGFADDSFADFFSILDAEYSPKEFSYFENIAKGMFSSNLAIDRATNHYDVVDVLTVSPENVSSVKDYLTSNHIGDYSFDVVGMNSAIANALSDNFNYIGWACGLIVFFFLWFSLGSIELALLSFLPMAISWIWILGIMGALGIQFNIVNVILATFIFGQGDDYTIFMTEGSCYEYAYRRKMLSSYKSSIIISALIMFVGIGALIIAKHPALHSLAEVTVVGMFSVVLMAYIFPPLIFNILVKWKGNFRMRPLSIRPLLSMAWSATVFFFQLFIVYLVGFVLFELFKATKKRKFFFHKFVHRLYQFDFKYMPGVKFNLRNQCNEDFERPVLVTSNHQSMLDAAIFMAISPKLILVANEHASSNWVTKTIFRWMDFYTLSGDTDKDIALLKSRISDGYSIVVFPEGERNPDSSILRFHKGACYLAQELKLDIVPIIIHGVNYCLPRNSFQLYRGTITVQVNDSIAGTYKERSYQENTKWLHSYYVEHYRSLSKENETCSYFRDFVIDRYRYKGVEITKSVKNRLSKCQNYQEWIEQFSHSSKVALVDDNYGELALLFALVHQNVEVFLMIQDKANLEVARYSAMGVVNNIHLVSSPSELTSVETNSIYAINADASITSDNPQYLNQ